MALGPGGLGRLSGLIIYILSACICLSRERQAGPWHAAGTAGAQHAGAAVAHSDDSMSTSGGAGAVAAAAAAGPGVAGGGPSWGRGVEEATSAWSGGGGELGRQPHAPILSVSPAVGCCGGLGAGAGPTTHTRTLLSFLVLSLSHTKTHDSVDFFLGSLS